MTRTVHVFCGPTITGPQVRQILPDAVIHPPVRHGDLLRIAAGPGDVAVIIDGVWHQAAPVRHKEILFLLASGVIVVGAASMGALRAAELAPFGMIGVGDIFARYRDGILTADDEVAVAHTPDDRLPLSEAMADIQAILTQAEADGVITGEEAACFAGQARHLHFTRRTWGALAAAAGPDSRAALDRLGHWRSARAAAASAKTGDAQAALELIAAGTLPAGPPGPWPAGQWGNIYLRDWLARFRGVDVDDVHVPLELMLRHQQIYSADFPRRWRRYVLSWMAGEPLPDPEARALHAAEAAGLSVRYLSAEQVAYWLTPAEAAELDDREQLARILVRAVAHDLTAPLWPASVSEASAGALLDPALDSAGFAAAAIRCNTTIAGAGPKRTIWHLREDLLRAHLAGLWDTGPDGEDLTAAARDRGFTSAADAIREARRFYLLAVGVLRPGTG